MTRQFSIVIIVIILASAAVLAVVQRQKGTTTNTSKENANAEVNVNTSANVNTLTNESTTTNTSSNTNAAEPLTLSIPDVIAGATRYNNTRLCLTAWYQNVFEFSAMAESVRIVNGEKVLSTPYVWINSPVPETSLTCTTNSVGEKMCLGVATTCGTFQYAAPGQAGLGHAQAYRYQLGPSEPIKKMPSVNIDTLIDTSAGY